MTALSIALSGDCFFFSVDLKDRDLKYAIKKDGDPPIRRKPTDKIYGKTVAQWFEPLIIDRLALASAILADIWVKTYLEVGKPRMCFSWLYVLKPSFVQPRRSEVLRLRDALTSRKKITSVAFTKTSHGVTNKVENWDKFRAATTEKCLTF